MKLWDADLERLASAVEQTFGQEALTAAMERAYGKAAAALRASANPRMATPFEECLRVELEQMLRPH